MGDILWLGPLLSSATWFAGWLVGREVERFWIWEVGCGGAWEGGGGRFGGSCSSID